MSYSVMIVPDDDGNPAKVTFAGSDARGKETLSVPGSATGFANIPNGTTKAVITIETAQIRYWVDGSNPTSSDGHLSNIGDAIVLDSPGQVYNFKAYGVGGTAKLQISYF